MHGWSIIIMIAIAIIAIFHVPTTSKIGAWKEKHNDLFWGILLGYFATPVVGWLLAKSIGLFIFVIVVVAIIATILAILRGRRHQNPTDGPVK